MNKHMLRNDEKKKNILKNIAYLCILFAAALCALSPVCAFAAPAASEEAGMFSALEQAAKFMRTIFLVGAAVSVVSFAFVFFVPIGIGGDRDAEKRIGAAWKKIGATCLACAALSLLPSFMVMGKEAVADIKWKSGVGVTGDIDSLHGSLSGNHVITPADTDGKTYATVDPPAEDPETEETDAP